MATGEATCPICSGDIPLAGDERAGEEVFCAVCGTPCVLRRGEGKEDFEAEEDV
jgi:hypothetical protein